MGRRWFYEVLEVIHNKKSTKFSSILTTLGISTSTLSRILKCLTEDSIIEKQILNDSPIEIRYCLNKKGQKLFSHLQIIKNI